MKYGMFLEELWDEDLLIWQKSKKYKLIREDKKVIYFESEIVGEVCGIERKCKGKRFLIVEKDGGDLLL